MENSLRFGKKALTLAIAAATILWTLGLATFAAPQTTQAAVSGDLIRGTSLSAVYYYGEDGQRYTFPNEKAYLTWYSDFSGVTTISDSELAAIPLGGNIMYRPGSRLIKVESDPKTYAVTPEGVLRWIETEAVAVGLVGSAWNTLIDDVNEVFFFDYTVGPSLMAAEAYEGMLISGSSYVVDGGQKRMITDAGLTANGFQDRFFVTPGDDLLGPLAAGPDVTGVEAGFADPTQMGTLPGTAPAGGLTVSLSSSSPAPMTVPSNANNIDFFAVDVSASGGPVLWSEWALDLGGLGAVGNLEAMYIYEGTDRLTSSRTFNNSTRQAIFGGLNVTVDPASGVRTFRAVGETLNPLPGGDTIQVGMKLASNIVSNGTVNGNFPIWGATMGTSATPVGQVTITPTGSIENPTIGSKDAKIAEFRVDATGTEGVWINQINLDIRDSSDHSNYKLWDMNTLLATGAPSGDTVKYLIGNPFFLAEGDNRNWEGTADIGGNAAQDVEVSIEQATDVVAIGDQYGFAVDVDITAYDRTGGCAATVTTECSFSQTQGGQLTIANNGPSAGSIPDDTTGVCFYDFTLTSENYVDIRDFPVTVAGSNLLGPTADNYQNWRIRHANGGSTLMGPRDYEAGATTNAATLAFTNDFSMNPGDSFDLQVCADTEDNDTDTDVLDGDTLTVSLDMANVVARDSNNDDLTPGTDIIPGTTYAGSQQTIETSALTVSVGVPPTSNTYVKGTTGFDAVGFNFTAADAASIEVTATTLTGRVSGSADGDLTNNLFNVQSTVASCSLYDALTGSFIDGPESFGTLTTPNMVFSGFSWTIDAGETNQMRPRCDLHNIIPNGANDDEFAIFIDSTGDITARDASGTSITPTFEQGGAAQTVLNEDDGIDATVGDNPVTFQTITTSGTLTFTLDGSSPESQIVLGNSTGVIASVFKATSTSEAFEVQEVTITNDEQDAPVSNLTWSCENAAGGTTTKTGFLAGGTRRFTGLDCYVPMNDSSAMTVLADTNEVSANGATSGTQFGLDFEVGAAADFQAVGLGSNETLDGTTVAGGDVAANVHTIRKTKPTLSLASGSPSGISIPSLIDAILFNVSADSRGYVTLNDILFKLSSTDNAGAAGAAADWNTCHTGAADGTCDGDGTGGLTASDFSFYDVTDLGSDLGPNGSWTFYDSAGGTVADTEDVVFFGLDLNGGVGAEEISAGSTNTYKVRFDATGASSLTDDTIRIDIPDQTEANAAGGLDAINWLDANTGAAVADGGDIDNLPVNGGALLF